MRRAVLTSLVGAVLAVWMAPAAAVQEVTNRGAVGAYELVEGWPAFAFPYPRAGYVMASQSGIFAESPNRIYLGGRGELKLPPALPPRFNGFWGSLDIPLDQQPPSYDAYCRAPWGCDAGANDHPAEPHNFIRVVDGGGRLVASWTQWDHLFEGGRGPHVIRMNAHDPQRHVWAIEDRHHQIFQFTNDGKSLVRTFGERGVAGEDGAHFNGPADLDFLPDGTFFVCDSKNSRVMKFDQHGNFVRAWGRPGSRPGEFNEVHGIAIGSDRRVYVSDQDNQRIQIFDEHGTYLAQWPNIEAQTLTVSANGHVWAFDSLRERYVEYDLTGRVLSWFTIPGTHTHQLSADADGNVYGADTYQGRSYKFRPRAGADPGKLLKSSRR